MVYVHFMSTKKSDDAASLDFTGIGGGGRSASNPASPTTEITLFPLILQGSEALGG